MRKRLSWGGGLRQSINEQKESLFSFPNFKPSFHIARVSAFLPSIGFYMVWFWYYMYCNWELVGWSLGTKPFWVVYMNWIRVLVLLLSLAKPLVWWCKPVENMLLWWLDEIKCLVVIKLGFGMVVDCFRTRPGEEYCNSRPSGSLSPKRELQDFATGLGVEHLAQATCLVLSDLFLAQARHARLSEVAMRPVHVWAWLLVQTRGFGVWAIDTLA